MEMAGVNEGGRYALSRLGLDGGGSFPKTSGLEYGLELWRGAGTNERASWGGGPMSGRRCRQPISARHWCGRGRENRFTVSSHDAPLLSHSQLRSSSAATLRSPTQPHSPLLCQLRLYRQHAQPRGKSILLLLLFARQSGSLASFVMHQDGVSRVPCLSVHC